MSSPEPKSQPPIAGSLRPTPRTLEQIREATGLDISCPDPDLSIDGVTVPTIPSPNKVLFLDDPTEEHLAAIVESDLQKCLVVMRACYAPQLNSAVIVHAVPRYAYAKVVSYLYDYENRFLRLQSGIAKSAIVSESAFVAAGVTIGEQSIVGANTILMPNVVVGANCSIGDNVIVKSGTVIGQPGFGIISDPELGNVHFPQVGGVIIEDNVEIGALNTVASGTILPTVVEESVKTNDHVHIGHNCRIGRKSIVNACADMSGSVRIGEYSWIGPNCSVINGSQIGDRALVGIGAVVVKPVGAGDVVVGNPARVLRKRK